VTDAELATLYATASAFAFLSEYEGFGLTPLEAMAAGVPVVQPRRGAFPEIVEKTGGGVIVGAEHPSALADALLELSRDRDRLERLGRAAYDGVRAHYSIERSVDRLIEVYASVARPA
jgi:glycosyltransferase involved in cell wall biosynthesis